MLSWLAEKEENMIVLLDIYTRMYIMCSWAGRVSMHSGWWLGMAGW